MGGILFGLFTPTEAAAVAVVYALMVPPIFYREPALRELPKIFADSARLSGVIGLIIGLVGAFGWVLTYSKFPFIVATAIAAMTPAWWVFIILVIFLYLILGTFLTPSEIILVTVPVLLPVATAVGVHPIHFGMVCVIASAIGTSRRQSGSACSSAWRSAACPMEKLVKPLLPFLTAIVVTLLLIAFIPDLIVLFLPRLLGFQPQLDNRLEPHGSCASLRAACRLPIPPPTSGHCSPTSPMPHPTRPPSSMASGG